MKKSVLFTLCAAAVLAGCKSELPEGPEVPGAKTVKAILTETKSYLGDKDGTSYPNYWAEGDVISLNGTASSPLDASYNGKSEAEFTFASAAAPYKAVYPASCVTAYADGIASILLPSEQTYVAGSYDPATFIMTAKSDADAALTFAPALCILKFVIDGTDNTKSIKLSADDGKKLSGAFTTDFSTFAAAEGASSEVTIQMPEGGVAPGTPIMLAIPAGDYSGGLTAEFTDANGGVMTLHATPSKVYEAGKMYATEVTEPVPALTAAEVSGSTSSTLVFNWDGDKTHAFTVTLYSNAACSAEVASFDIPAGDACWNRTLPTYVFGGLTPGTKYWFKVIDTTDSIESNVVEATTAAFDIAQMPASINATGVVLAEDFGELRWQGDMLANASGFIPNTTSSFSSTDVKNFVAGNSNSGEVKMTTTAPLASSRLAGWAYDSNVYYHCGYLKMGTSSGKGWILTPQFTVPEGYKAIVKVIVTAARYNSSQDENWAIAVLNEAQAQVSGYAANFSWPDATDQKYQLVGPLATSWTTVSAEGLEVLPGDRIAFGPKNGADKAKSRVFIGDITVEVTELIEPTVITDPIAASLLEATSSTLSFEWKEGGEAADDANLAYTATLYSDAACTSPVLSYSFAEGQGTSLWRDKYPKFIFAGLNAGTQYYFRVSDGNGQKSNIVPAKTAAFTVVTIPASITGPGVILAEDFSLFTWDFEYGQGCVGMAAPDTQTSFTVQGTDPVKFAENVGAYQVFTSGAFASSRLNKWARDAGTDARVRVHPGYITLGSFTNNQKAWLLTPPFPIPDGKVAIVTVSLTARKGMTGATGDYALGILNNSSNNGANGGGANMRDENTSDFSWPDDRPTTVYNAFTVNNDTSWQTFNYTGMTLKAGDRIVVGSRANYNYSSKKSCLNLSDITVTVTAIEDAE